MNEMIFARAKGFEEDDRGEVLTMSGRRLDAATFDVQPDIIRESFLSANCCREEATEDGGWSHLNGPRK